MSIFVVIVLLAFMPMNAQNEPEKKIEPVEPKTEPKVKPDVKKYNLNIVYVKGMVFDRVFKIKTKMDMNSQQGMAMNTNAVVEFKLNNTILDVKDGIPLDLKCKFTEVKTEGVLPGEFPGEESQHLKDFKKLKGHWFRIKKSKKGVFELVEKSKDFPEITSDINMFDNINESTLMMFDDIALPKESVAVGESIKFDYKNKMFIKKILEGMENKLDEMKIKFEKVVEKDGVILGYFTGKTEKDIGNMGNETIKINISVNMVLDISNNRCIKMDMIPGYEMGGEGFLMVMTFGMYTENTYSSEKKKVEPKIQPKDEDE